MGVLQVKRLLRASIAVSVAAALSLGLFAGSAVAIDQYSHKDFSNFSASNLIDYQNGWRKLAIDDSFNGSATSAVFAAYAQGNDASYELCETVTSGPCLDPAASFIMGESILPVCSPSVQENCVQGLSVGTSSNSALAMFSKSLEGFTFPANPAAETPAGGTVSVWSATEFPHSGGSDYAVSAQINWFRSAGRTTYRDLTIRIAAVQERFEAQSRVTVPYTVENGGPGGSRVKGRAANHNPGKNGCFYVQNQVCAYEQEFSPGARLKLSLKVSNKVTGWLFGRLKDPIVSITSGGPGQSIVEIEAEPVEVPKLHARWNVAEIPDVIDDSRGRGVFGDGNLMAGSTDRESFDIVEKLRNKTLDTATGLKTYWSLASRLGPQQCVTASSSLVGIVTTNAMVFSGGPPVFENGYLSYQVAGLHYRPGGTEVQEGTYDMLIKADVARCIFGYSKAPISATVAVVGNDAEQKVATTVVAESDGWLKLAAYGFTFSEKELRVHFTQPQKQSIGKFTGTSKTVSLVQQFQLREFARLAQSSKDISCSVTYQKPSEMRLAQLRAESACKYLARFNSKARFTFKAVIVKSKSLANALTVASK